MTWHQRLVRALLMFAWGLLTFAGPSTFAQEGGSGNPEGGGQTDPGADRSAWTLQAEDQAVDRARLCLGLAEPDQGRTIAATLTTASTDTTPFLSAHLVGRPIWRVAIDGWRMELQSAPDAKDRYHRTLDVFVDPVDGRLLKILSRWPQGVPEGLPIPPAAFAEQQMRRSRLEVFHGFPEEPPSITFLQALDIIVTDGVGSPFVAKQILAHYVLGSFEDREPVPLWSITLRGIGQIRASNPNVPAAARNHIRNIIDARTGEWLYATSTPQPEGRPTRWKPRGPGA